MSFEKHLKRDEVRRCGAAQKPTHNLTHTAKCAERFKEHRTGSLVFLPGVFGAVGLLLHDLSHEAAQGFRRSVPSGVGVGAEGAAF